MKIDETWGLSWSRRWHAIDLSWEEKMRLGGFSVGRHARSLCGGSPIYRQTEIHSKNHLVQLMDVVNNPELAPICKKCLKKLDRLMIR